MNSSSKSPRDRRKPSPDALPAWVRPGGVDPAEIRAKATNGNGISWRYAQLREWGVPIPPPWGWRKALEVAWRDAQGLTPRCAVCSDLVDPDHAIVITRGLNPDGSLRAFYFCREPHKREWQKRWPGLDPIPEGEGENEALF